MHRKFLTAEWRKLIMANYLIDPLLLQPFLPAKTELDSWNGHTYVSLVGFMFQNTRIMGMPIAFHINFPEVNLRFYVKYKDKRGVVFLKEIVPKPAITFVANTFFREKYSTLPMKHYLTQNDKLRVGYEWKFRKRWNVLKVDADTKPQALKEGSEEEFISEHFWGYTNMNAAATGEYKVEHPRWDIYPVHNYTVDCDFENLYGPAFVGLSNQTPHSVFLAEGSPISVYSKRIL